MAVNLSPVAGVAGQLFDNNGDPLTGGKVFTYSAGTTTPQTTYTNASGSVPHSNPIILDAAGRVPGGEIWLTDSLLYKFVITDSSNVLIGTYDNIAGINSNFVNFVNQQEIQTATAGQTVFTLATTTYQPGTNSLSVFVDGVNQYGPGASYAYLETNSTTVTFVTGLHVGAEVKFTTSQINSSAATSADQVSYLPAGTGAVATNVQAKLRQTVSVKDFGAVGDGVTDDTVAIQNAIAWVLANPEHDLWFDETTYLVGSSVTSGGSIFTLVGSTGFTMRGRPTFRVTGTNAKLVYLFHIQMGNVAIEYVKAIGDVWTLPSHTVAVGFGVNVLYIQNPTAGTTIKGFNFGEVISVNGSFTVLFDANTKTYGLSSDVYIGTINSTEGNYGLNCAHSPNNLVCNQVICDNVFRGYFAYGVDNHVVNVEFKPTYTGIFAGGTCTNIAVYTETTPGSSPTRVADTRNINVKIFNTSNRPTFQLSTQTQAATDTAQGMYNIFVDAVSTAGSPLKIANTVGGVIDTVTTFDSPKENIYIRACDISPSSAILDSNDYGVFNTANCVGLTLEGGDFLNSALAARESMYTSGWNIIDARFGRQYYQQYWVAKAGTTSILQVATNEDPHLSIGSDSSNITRWRAGTSHIWYVGGALTAQLTSSFYRPWVDNTLALGGASNRWSVVYAATGTINTSDANDKDDIRLLSEKEKAVGVALRGLIRAFKWKTGTAQTYVGVIAQDVIAAFDAEGLDASDYGIIDDSGDRLGVRYDQVFAFIIGAL